MDRKLRPRGNNNKKPESTKSKDLKPRNCAKKKLKPRTSAKKQRKSPSNRNNNSKPDTVANGHPKSGSNKNRRSKSDPKDPDQDPKSETIRNNEPKPGPSRDVDSSDQPKKKCKVEDAEVRNGRVCKLSCKNINDLPNEMLLEIFRYLSVPERLKAEKVCIRWQKLAATEDLWRSVRVSDVPPPLLVEIIASLPPCVLHLECVSNKDCLYILPLGLKQIAIKLRERCPSLKSFILRNVITMENYKLLPITSKTFLCDLAETEKNVIEEAATRAAELGFLNSEDVSNKAASLQELKVLSFRKLLCGKPAYPCIKSTLFPNLTVLDLSHSQVELHPLLDQPFPNLVHLEEIYLQRWMFSGENSFLFLKYLKKLRLLDVSNCIIVDNFPTYNLMQYGKSLEELYLCCSSIFDIPINSEENEILPRLQTLCVKGTFLRNKNVEELMIRCPSLKFVYVNYNGFFSKEWYDSLSENLKEKLSCSNIEECECNHFLKSKFKRLAYVKL